MQALAPGRILEVEHEAPLVAVGVAEIHALAGAADDVARLGVAGGVAARLRILDLDHLGAEIREQHRRPGSGQEARQVEDPDAGQGCGAAGLIVLAVASEQQCIGPLAPCQ
jgi:hypothetical protein